MKPNRLTWILVSIIAIIILVIIVVVVMGNRTSASSTYNRYKLASQDVNIDTYIYTATWVNKDTQAHTVRLTCGIPTYGNNIPTSVKSDTQFCDAKSPCTFKMDFSKYERDFWYQPEGLNKEELLHAINCDSLRTKINDIELVKIEELS